jgi:hypothetical protein
VNSIAHHDRSVTPASDKIQEPRNRRARLLLGPAKQHAYRSSALPGSDGATSRFGSLCLLEHPRGLLRRAPEDVAQHEHGPRQRREVLDRGDERQLDGLLRERHVWTDERIVAALEDWADANGDAPTQKKWEPARSVPSASTIRRHFGSWGDALDAAGFDTRSRS